MTRAWNCWVITSEDIDVAAEWMGKSPDKLRPEDYDTIVERFIKGLQKRIPDWPDLLEDAINSVEGKRCCV